MPDRPIDEAAIVDSTAALESLYQAPLAEFVSRRSALASRLKRSGHKDVAARIAAAAKPSRAAFLVNQVHWRERAAYDAVLEAGSAARAAQQARLLGDDSDLAVSLRARDTAVTDAVDLAGRIADGDGTPLSDATRAQVRATFEAIAAHGQEGRLPHGQLTTDVELPGLGALAGLVLPAAVPAPVRKFEVVARRSSESTDAGNPPAPDPRRVELEARLAEARQREGDSLERLAEIGRALAASHEVLAQAQAAAEEAGRTLRAAQDAVARGERARDAAEADAARVAAEREAAERELDGPPPDGPPPTADRAPTPGRRARGSRRPRR